jgi:hypothetical protein
MTMKPQCVAASLATVPTKGPVKLRNVIIHPSAHAASLPGLSLNWRPTSADVDEVHSTICCLLEQAFESFRHDDDLDPVQWGGIQQLAMARHLYSSMMDVVYNLEVLPPAATGEVQS